MGQVVSQTVQGAPGLNGGAAPSSTNPITGVFGSGNVRFFSVNDTFTVPAGCTLVRARVWGGGNGGGNGTAGGGGGFSLKVCTVTPGESISVTVGAQGGTSSFGSHCSATGGETAAPGLGGTGIGGDMNYTGGNGVGLRGGGAANVFGNGGFGGFGGASGGGGGGGGVTGAGGGLNQNAQVTSNYPALDFLGTGGGGGDGSGSNPAGSGVNGGGGGAASGTGPNSGNGGFPGGGGGGYAGSGSSSIGGRGLVVVEW